MGREAVLGRIRAALGRNGQAAAAATEQAQSHMAQHARGPRSAWDEDVVARFRARAESLASTVDSVATSEDVPHAVALYLVKNALPTGGVCWPTLRGLPWIGAGLGMEGRPVRPDDLVGVTGCFCAIADTGTLMMLSGPNTPPATSLLPETHIAVVPVSRIVAQMEDAWDLLRKEHKDMPRAVNFVSGPSRTADIEQTVTLGAHGPYRVHLILVKGA